MLGKAPNEMTQEDVEKLVLEKREHNNEVIAIF